MKRLIFLIAILIPFALNAQVTITKSGDALKFTGLGVGNTSISNQTYSYAYFTSIDQVLIKGSRILFVNSASQDVMAEVKYSDIADKLGQLNAKDYVEHIIDLGYLAKPISSDTLSVQEISPAAGGYPNAMHWIGTEVGTATYTSANTLTLSGSIPTINNHAQLVCVKYVRDGASGMYVNGQNGITLTESANVITIAGATGDTIASGDNLEVGVNAPYAWEDKDVGAINIVSLNPESSHYTNFYSFTTTNDTLTASWADWGDPYEVLSYNKVIVLFTLDVNSSTDVRIRVLYEYDDDNYNTQIYTESSTEIKLTPAYFEIDSDTDQNIALEVDVKGADKLQFQIQAGTVGATAGIILGDSQINKKH